MFTNIQDEENVVDNASYVAVDCGKGNLVSDGKALSNSF